MWKEKKIESCTIKKGQHKRSLDNSLIVNTLIKPNYDVK